MTSGFSGSPAPTTSRSDPGPPDRSALISIRHTVGGAQKLVTSFSRSTSSRSPASKRAYDSTTIVASEIHGAKKHDQSCLAQPGLERFRCLSPGRRPIQKAVERCPTGYDTWVCSTSLGRAVVPDVKYNNSGSPGAVPGWGS